MKAPRTRWLKLAAANAAVLAALCAVIEGGAWLYLEYAVKRGPDYSVADRFQDVPDVYGDSRVDERGRGWFVSRSLPTRYYSTDRELRNNAILSVKPPRSMRVFVYGGSSVAGAPWGPWASFVRSLDDQLKALARPGVEVEVMNFGVSSLSSSRIAAMVEWTIEDAPDLIVVYAGHNEICDAAAARNPARAWAERLARASNAARLVLRTAAPDPAMPQEPFAAAACDAPPVLDEAGRGELDDEYAENVDRIIESGRRAGATVVLMSQVSNMLIEPEGEESAAERDYDAGLAALRAGRLEEARKRLQSAIDADPRPRRFRSAQREILRARHDPDEGVHFVDAAAFVAAYADGGIIDGRFVIDLMHPNATAQRLLAESLFEGFLVPNGWMKDRLDYGRYDGKALWGWRPAAEAYFRACLRYYPSMPRRAAPPVLRAACLKAAHDELSGAGDVDEQANARRVWEFLWVWARESEDAAALKDAERMLGVPKLWRRVAAVP
ncbi:MAG: SGNH/GDSL hydrolase family protein [Elusimicrobiota bacterium]|nr:SGNH/GDSL hydrolase family protein [Elusimicrobiota bacterium]